MSVLIKGISMPKEPWECPCHDGETGWCKVTGSSCFPIPKDCPLVEVTTPHEAEGRMMSDLISRQAAIDALKREKIYCKAYRDGYAHFKQYNMGLNDGIKALNKLPSAQKKGCVDTDSR